MKQSMTLPHLPPFKAILGLMPTASLLLFAQITFARMNWVNRCEHKVLRSQGIVFVVKAIEPLTTALLAIPLLNQAFNLRSLGIDIAV